MTTSDGLPPLLRLPSELLFHILAFLAPTDLARISRTCTALHSHSYDDKIWQPFINTNLSNPIAAPHPLKSFRDLYIAHHPHWFLPHHRIWFADTNPTGKLIVSRFDAESGCIVAYAVVAIRGEPTLYHWEKDPRVIIHTFDPQVLLNLERPVLKLSVDSTKTDDQPNSLASDRNYGPPSEYSKETLMDVSADSGLYSSFMLCRTLPPAAISEATAVWPPLRFPAIERVRNESRNGYDSTGHRPSALSEVSEHNFRLRKWVEYSGRRTSPQRMSFNSTNGLVAALGMAGSYISAQLRANGHGGMTIRMPEDISTYATLPKSCYTPTPEKPWQGIWCGDYSGHGCEFLLIQQPDEDKQIPLPEGMNWLRPWFGGQTVSAATAARNLIFPDINDHHDDNYNGQTSDEEDQSNDFTDVNPPSTASANALQHLPELTKEDAASMPFADIDDKDAPSGRLEAIKLTGDPNIPRGEYTFIAPDIGTNGLLRVADEEIFRGARIVRSAGHIAAEGFWNGKFDFLAKHANELRR